MTIRVRRLTSDSFQLCPYSRALKYGAEVTVTKS